MELAGYYRRKRYTHLKKRAVFLVFFFFLLVSAVWGFFWISLFRISKIDIVAANRSAVEEAIIPSLASLNGFWLPKDHYLLVSIEKIKADLHDGGLGAALVEKSFPNKLIIRFENTEPWMIFCAKPEDVQAVSDEKCYYVDGKGALSESAPKFSENPLPQIRLNAENARLGENIISEEKTAFLKEWFSYLKTLGAVPLAAEILREGEIKIFLKEGWFLDLQTKLNSAKTFNDVKLLLDQKIKSDRSKLEYIDLRFENKAFYKFR